EDELEVEKAHPVRLEFGSAGIEADRPGEALLIESHGQEDHADRRQASAQQGIVDQRLARRSTVEGRCFRGHGHVGPSVPPITTRARADKLSKGEVRGSLGREVWLTRT